MAPDLTAALVAQFISIRAAAEAALALLGSTSTPRQSEAPAGCQHPDEARVAYVVPGGHHFICRACEHDTGKESPDAELPDHASAVDRDPQQQG